MTKQQDILFPLITQKRTKKNVYEKEFLTKKKLQGEWKAFWFSPVGRDKGGFFKSNLAKNVFGWSYLKAGKIGIEKIHQNIDLYN